jgi:hypothetical protein
MKAATIVCCDCGRHPLNLNEVELSPEGLWRCQECISTRYSLSLLDFIKTRISVTKTEDEDRSKFVLRELVQNADDANASIIVLRFERDALYVANDGRAFSTVGPGGQPGDFERAAQVLRRFKADEKESAGHFGSGFQTIYAITNRPEVHSNAISRALNPAEMSWENLSNHRYSPYMAGEQGRKGVLFRLPWRDDEAAQTSLLGERPFLDENFWPRWNNERIRAFYDDLKSYLPAVILCCQRLRSIRMIWAADSKPEAYDASRDFALNQPLEKPTAISITTGQISAPANWYRWDKGVEECQKCPISFAREAVEYEEPHDLKYLAASSTVADEQGHTQFMVKDDKGIVRVVGKLSEDRKEIKKNHLHILMPLFLARRNQEERSRGNSFLYSVIPLPRRGYNRFAFSAHLIPTEDRKDVDVQGNDEANLRWYRLCMLGIARLYQDLFPHFLTYVKQLRNDMSEKQSIVLQNLPESEIGEWMRPGRGDTDWAQEHSKSLRDWLFAQPILATSGDHWASPSAAYSYSGTDKQVLETLCLDAYPDEFISMCEEVAWLRQRAEQHGFTRQDFTRIWTEIVKANDPKAFRYLGTVILPSGRKLSLTKQACSCLVRYSLQDEETASLNVIPDVDGFLKGIHSFPRLPNEARELGLLLPTGMRIHPDFVELITESEAKKTRRKVMTTSELPELISKIVEMQPKRFAAVSSYDHRILSEMVRLVVLDETFAPDKVIGKNFLPFSYDHSVHVGPCPASEPQHAGENYQRDWIFAPGLEVPGMTDEIQAKIRILDLKGLTSRETAKVASRLNLVALAEPPAGQVTNFIRHFVSGIHGSLFDDAVLAKFLASGNPEYLRKQKNALLNAVRMYFNRPKTEEGLTPEDMGSVPCLYDLQGKWHQAKEFAFGEDSLLNLLGFRALHSDFSDWPSEALEALGVTVEDTAISAIAAKITELASQPERNRNQLATLFGALIISYSPKNLKEIADCLIEIPWIPIGGLHAARAPDAVYPNDELVALFGEKHRPFIDLGRMRSDVLQELTQLAREKRAERLTALGVRFKATIQEMIDFASLCAKRLAAPPENLLRMLSEQFGKVKPDERALWLRKLAPGDFYWSGRWWKGDKIRILGKQDVHLSLEAIGLLVLKAEEATIYADYLEVIGARQGLVVDDLLHGLELLARQSPNRIDELRSLHDKLWAKVEERASEISQEVSDELEKRPLYLLPSGRVLYRPIDVLLDDVGLTSAPVHLGRACVVPRGTGFWAALSKLGAPRISNMGSKKAYTFMSYAASGDGTITEQETELYLGLLLRFNEHRWLRSEEPLLWPSSSRHSLRFASPTDCYVANDIARELFVEVPMLVTSTARGHHPELDQLARAWKSRELQGEIKYPNQNLQNRDTEIEGLVLEAYSHLVGIFGKSDRESLGWMKDLEAARTRGRVQAYAVGQTRGMFSIPAIVPFSLGQTVLLMPEEGVTQEQLADKIVGWSVGCGFPREKANELKNLFLDEYARAIEEKAQLRPGYVETLAQLRMLYGGCQICGWRTPEDEESGNSVESILSVVALKGGLIRGTFYIYEIGNCLYLCPRHQALGQRRLIRFPFLRGPRPHIKRRLQEATRHMPELGESLVVEVYEWNPYGHDDSESKKGWKKRQLTITEEHAKAIFERLVNHFEHEE